MDPPPGWPAGPGYGDTTCAHSQVRGDRVRGARRPLVYLPGHGPALASLIDGGEQVLDCATRLLAPALLPPMPDGPAVEFTYPVWTVSAAHRSLRPAAPACHRGSRGRPRLAVLFASCPVGRVLLHGRLRV